MGRYQIKIGGASAESFLNLVDRAITFDKTLRYFPKLVLEDSERKYHKLKQEYALLTGSSYTCHK